VEVFFSCAPSADTISTRIKNVLRTRCISGSSFLKGPKLADFSARILRLSDLYDCGGTLVSLSSYKDLALISYLQLP
jgi:hypothetical protein